VDQEILEIFANYNRAFVAEDYEAIAQLWHYPCMISWETQTLPVYTPAQFLNGMNKLGAHYKSIGFAGIETTVREVRLLSDQSALVAMTDKMTRADASLIGEWEYFFVLRHVPDGWKIVSAVVDDEAAYLSAEKIDFF
jgi:Domain of unknown function (DUF4440)